MIAAIIQARMGASRLPGKVLKKIDSVSLLEFQINRVKKSQNIKDIIVATSTKNEDNLIENLCNKIGIKCFRGSENDVLARYYECAKIYEVDTVIRLTADCPLIDPYVIDSVLENFQSHKIDYASNTVPPKSSKWPDGSDVEIFTFNALKRAHEEATDDDDREHVTFYFWKKPNGFKTFQLDNKYDWSKYRFTVDYIEDFKAIKLIYRELQDRKIFGHIHEIIKILEDRPDIKNLNEKYYFGIGWEK